jgi:2-dehydro-3-deoxyglucarate aldolase/4-hydroxy-2-oxoheptanedioate aldolase
MKVSKVKKALREGGVALGTMVFEFATTGIARLAAGAGADFIMIDMEHTGWTHETVRLLVATAQSADTVPMVRVPTSEYHLMARALDVGAMGIMVPMVESAEQARKIVQSCKYPPVGRRGCAFGVSHDGYAAGDPVAKMRAANEQLVLIAQIENAAGMENLEAIAATPEIDVLWLGHYDLTASLGIPGQFDHPRYHECVARIADACRRHGKAAGFMASSVEEAKAMLTKGYRSLAYWGDLWIYKSALAQGLAAVRAGLGRE